ncbi:MAG: FxsA family protein [Pseudomonadota bacterium]
MPLFLIFVIVPIIEIALFIQVGGFLGLWPTLAIVVLTAFAGSTLLRNQGLSTLARLQSSMAQGQDPSRDLAHGAMILIAGVVLLTPGFFTDAIGLLLMLPPVRDWVIKAGGAKIAANANIHVQGFDTGPQPSEDIVDADFEDVTDDKPKSPPSGWVQ